MPTRILASRQRRDQEGVEFMPIVIGAKRESDFTDPIGMLGDCHRRIEMFLNVLVRVAEQAKGAALNEEQRGALETALRYFREAAPKHTADEEESLFPRLRQIESAEVRALMVRIESLEEEHVCADRSHGEVDSLGRLWLKDGMLPADRAARLLTLVLQLRDLYRHHIATEDNEVFPAAALALFASDRQAIGSEMAHRRGSTANSARRKSATRSRCAISNRRIPRVRCHPHSPRRSRASTGSHPPWPEGKPRRLEASPRESHLVWQRMHRQQSLANANARHDPSRPVTTKRSQPE
jgi:hemerythrin-like domain-containing protein